MKTSAAILIVAIILFGRTAVVCAAGADSPKNTYDPQTETMTLGVVHAARRVEPTQEVLSNHGRVVQFVERVRFSNEERKKMRAFHDEHAAVWKTPLPVEIACPQAQRYAQGILDRLIEGSSLRQTMHEADFPVQLVVTCGVADFPDAAIKAGVLELSAELVLAMRSEDEIAAMMGHELAHYTLAHDAKKLAMYPRLTASSARALSITHELEADAEGLTLLANAGYDPYAAVDVLTAIRARLRARRLLIDAAHPNLGNRIRNLQQQISRMDLMPLVRSTQGLAEVHEELRRRPLALLKKRQGAD